ncbi:hypothetical protein BC830DRAFT_516330 [Chytriomyces sp. MP71]|nr:hypothetical protein BC830DRAFT_516330 [Chytriomyces sp. MP71]
MEIPPSLKSDPELLRRAHEHSPSNSLRLTTHNYKLKHPPEVISVVNPTQASRTPFNIFYVMFIQPETAQDMKDIEDAIRIESNSLASGYFSSITPGTTSTPLVEGSSAESAKKATPQKHNPMKVTSYRNQQQNEPPLLALQIESGIAQVSQIGSIRACAES